MKQYHISHNFLLILMIGSLASIALFILSLATTFSPNLRGEALDDTAPMMPSEDVSYVSFEGEGERRPMQLSINAYQIPGGPARPAAFEVDITSRPRGAIEGSFDCRAYFRGREPESYRQEGLCIPDDFTENVQLTGSIETGSWSCKDLDLYAEYLRERERSGVSGITYILALEDERPGDLSARPTRTLGYRPGKRIECTFLF